MARVALHCVRSARDGKEARGVLFDRRLGHPGRSAAVRTLRAAKNGCHRDHEVADAEHVNRSLSAVIFTPPITGEDAGRSCGDDCNIPASAAKSGGPGNVQPVTHRRCCPSSVPGLNGREHAAGQGGNAREPAPCPACVAVGPRTSTPRTRGGGLRRDLDQQGFARENRGLDRQLPGDLARFHFHAALAGVASPRS